MKNQKVGLIEGRHNMPVNYWLLPANISDIVGFHQGVYDAAKQAAINLVVEQGSFDLYLTGLTVAALGAVDGMRSSGVESPVVWNFDRETNQYIPIKI